jgi:copper(I)-binding protein
MRVSRIYLLVLLPVLLLFSAGCGPKSIQVTDAWARPATAGEIDGAFFTITNQTNDADTLLSVSTDAARMAEIHETMLVGDTMTMQPVASVPVPAKSTVEFKSGGLHVMLVNLTNELKAGDSFNLTLNFDRSGPISVKVTVREP